MSDRAVRSPATAGIDTVSRGGGAGSGGPAARGGLTGRRRPVLLTLAGLVAIGAASTPGKPGAAAPRTGSTGTPSPAGTKAGRSTAPPVVRSVAGNAVYAG